MTIHSILLGFVLAILIGAAFHLLRGGSLQRLGLHLLAANLSFFLGQWLSELIHWQFLRVGAINLFPSILATLIGLVLTTTLAGEEPEKDGKKKPRRKRRK
jgi:uncharacterized membrane protein YjjP (DUF1212 family)